MSLFRQLLIANSQKKKRPYYCEVEYLESTGTQYIDTGVKGTTTTIGVDVEWEFSNADSDMCIFSSRSNQISNTFTLFWLKTSNNRARFDASGQIFFNDSINTSSNQLYRFTYKSADGDAVMYNLTNGNSETKTVGRITTLSTNNLYLFSSRDAGMVVSYIKMYYFKLYDGDTLLRDMIPVLDWDMKPCMYDKVSGQLFYNQGTGEFLYGREIHYVEYLEGTGTQYIDTGVYFNDTTHTYEWDVDAQAINSGHTSGYNWFTGYNQNGVNSCGTYGDGVTYTFYPAGTYYQNGEKVSVPSGGDKYAPVKNIISLTNKICDYSLVLFARMVSSSNTIDAGGTKRIFTAKYYDNSVLVRDYYPAVDENGVGFMFDRVTHTIFDNAGTGAFNYPPVELEYLKTDSNTNWISTTIKPTTETNFETKVMYEGTSTTTTWALGSTTWVGVHKDGATQTIGITQGTLTEKKCYVPYENNTDITLKLDGKNVYANGILVGTVQRLNATSTLDIFRYYNGSNLWWNGRIYYLKINEGGAPTLDLIPALKDGQVGMWDKVNGVLYTNAGTGSFITGRIVEKESEV